MVFRHSLARFLFASGILIVLLAVSVRADTYSNWKARVFSQDEQGDPAISGEITAANKVQPTGFLPRVFAATPTITAKTSQITRKDITARPRRVEREPNAARPSAVMQHSRESSSMALATLRAAAR